MSVNWNNSRDEALELVRKDVDGNFYDPDAGLDPELREWACSLSLSFFNRLRLIPRHIADDASGKEQPGFMHVEAGGEAHLVFVRVTMEDETETGAGPMPGILIDQALAHKAQPHIVRVHFKRSEGGTSFKYYGHDDLVRELRQGEWWRRRLMRGRWAKDYLRMAGGQTSRLNLLIKQDPPGMRTPEPAGDSPLLEGCEPDLTPYFFPGLVELALSIDPDPDTNLNQHIGAGALLASAQENDEFYIFTCDCGVPGCAGIWSGVDVVHEDGLVVWMMRGSRPRRILVFDERQYREEIFNKFSTALEMHKTMGPDAWFNWHRGTACIERLWRMTWDL